MTAVEPGISAVVARETGAGVDWSLYRRCPTCRAAIGEPCTSAATSICEGQVVGPPAVLAHPHGYRRRRSARSIGAVTR